MKRISGYLLSITAGLGILFSLAGLIGVWTYGPIITRKSLENLTLVSQSLDSTDTILSAAGTMVQTTTLDVTSLQASTNALSTGIRDTTPMLDSMIRLSGSDIPAAIASTKASLESAQSSATLIDNILSVLTSVPFSPVAPYKPKVPLHIALQNVSSSLDALTPSLQEIKTSLSSEKTDLQAVDNELTKISASTQEIHTSLGDAQTAIADYRLTIQQLKTNVDNTMSNFPRRVIEISLVLTVLLLWLMVMFIGLGLHGLEMLQ